MASTFLSLHEVQFCYSGDIGGDTEKVGRGEDDEAVVVSSDVVSFPKTTTAPSTAGYEGMYPPNDEEEDDENDEEFSNEDASEKKSSEVGTLINRVNISLHGYRAL